MRYILSLMLLIIGFNLQGAPLPPPPPLDPFKIPFLGVTEGAVFNPRMGAVVGNVIPLSSAWGFIRTGDSIIRVCQTDITNFDDLKKCIGTYRLGATVEIEVWRNNNSVNLKFTLNKTLSDFPELEPLQ